MKTYKHAESSSGLHFLYFVLAHDAAGFEDQDADEDREGDGVAVGREERAPDERLRDADDHPADRRACDIADAAEHSRYECLQARHNAHQRLNARILRRVEYSARRSQRRADHERERNDAADIYAHQTRCLLAMADGSHCRPHLRFHYDDAQTQHQHERDDDHNELRDVDRQHWRLDKRRTGDNLRKTARRGAKDKLRKILQKKWNADRGDEHSQPRTIPERTVRQKFYRRAEQSAEDHRDKKDDHRMERGANAKRPRQQVRHVISHIRTDHENIAMREINESQHAIDHRIPQRDQRVDRPERDAVYKLL